MLKIKEIYRYFKVGRNLGDIIWWQKKFVGILNESLQVYGMGVVGVIILKLLRLNWKCIFYIYFIVGFYKIVGIILLIGIISVILKIVYYFFNQLKNNM